MTRYLVKRFAGMVFTLWVVVTATFFLFRAVPGDPSLVLIGPELEASAAAAIRESFGLDGSLWSQYWSYLSNAIRGDLGTSFRYGLPVSTVLGVKMVNTLVLVLPAVLIAFGFGLGLGSVAAARWRSKTDRLITQTFLAIKSAPAFWIGTMALVVFSFWLGWTPSGGMATPGAPLVEGVGRFASVDFLLHLALPLAVFSMILTVEPALTMRTSMVNVLGDDFIDLGLAKGLSRRRIWVRHAARNSLLPVVSLLAAVGGHLIGGAVIIEIVFSWPGMGREMVEAVNRFDYPVMQGAFMAIAALAIIFNALADVLYTYLDPRVRLT